MHKYAAVDPPSYSLRNIDAALGVVCWGLRSHTKTLGSCLFFRLWWLESRPSTLSSRSHYFFIPTSTYIFCIQVHPVSNCLRWLHNFVSAVILLLILKIRHLIEVHVVRSESDIVMNEVWFAACDHMLFHALNFKIFT